MQINWIIICRFVLVIFNSTGLLTPWHQRNRKLCKDSRNSSGAWARHTFSCRRGLAKFHKHNSTSFALLPRSTLERLLWWTTLRYTKSDKPRSVRNFEKFVRRIRQPLRIRSVSYGWRRSDVPMLEQVRRYRQVDTWKVSEKQKEYGCSLVFTLAKRKNQLAQSAQVSCRMNLNWLSVMDRIDIYLPVISFEIYPENNII